MENCDFPHTSYVSVSNAYVTNILFPVTITISDQSFGVGVQLILGFSEETDGHILASLFSEKKISTWLVCCDKNDQDMKRRMLTVKIRPSVPGGLILSVLAPCITIKRSSQ